MYKMMICGVLFFIFAVITIVLAILAGVFLFLNKSNPGQYSSVDTWLCAGFAIGSICSIFLGMLGASKQC